MKSSKTNYLSIIIFSLAFLSFFELPAAAQEYMLVFGGTHAHSSFSDGTATPAFAYDTARASGNAGFWFMTEHYQSLDKVMDANGQPTDKKEWDVTLETAKAKTENGAFAALVGWEWSNGTDGHLNVLFDPSEPPSLIMTGAFDRLISYWLKKHSKALIGFNHPQWSTEHKLNNFSDFAYVPEIASQTVYMEVYVPEDIPYFYRALDNGWRIAPLGAQDNHGPDWALRPEFIGAYTTAITQKALYDALASRRFYSTIDPALILNFTANGQPMGSILKPGGIEMKIDLSHKQGKTISRVQLVTNRGEVLKEWTPDAPEFHQTETVSAASGETKWFLAYAATADGAFVMSAPVWVAD